MDMQRKFQLLYFMRSGMMRSGRSGLLKPWHIHLRMFLSFSDDTPLYGTRKLSRIWKARSGRKCYHRVAIVLQFCQECQHKTSRCLMIILQNGWQRKQEGLNAEENLKLKWQTERARSAKCLLTLSGLPVQQGAGRGRQLNSICLLTWECCTHTAPCGKFCLGYSMYH